MRGRTDGFTLIEVLVALVILATMAGAIVLSMPGLEHRRAEREADRLGALLMLACEQAELSGRELGVHLAQMGYGFSLADRDSWLPFPAGHRFEGRRVEAVRMTLPDGDLPFEIDYEQPPQATCWPSGELSALDIRFMHDERALARVVTGADAKPVVEVSDEGRDRRPLR